MKKSFLILGFVFSILFPLHAFGAGIVINEVFFDPAGSDTGLEWIEFYNSSDVGENISGWELYPDGVGYYTFSQGFVLGSKKFLVIHLRSSSSNTTTDLSHSAATANMGNTSGSVALFSGEPRGKDTMRAFLQWGRAGETWEGDAEKASLWQKGAFVDLANFKEGNAIILLSGTSDPAKKENWIIAATPTPGAPNQTAPQSASSVPPPSSVSSSASSSLAVAPPPPAGERPALPIETIRAFAGEDTRAVTGSPVEFKGNAAGLKGDPLEQARFWWNFGDGEFKEGKNTDHVFRFPGVYQVTLSVSSGEYSAADYVTAEILSNQIEIGDVTAGEEGFIRLKNPMSIQLDITGWIIEDPSGRVFAFPPKSVIGAYSEIALANRTTGLFKEKKEGIVAIRYQNSLVIAKRAISFSELQKDAASSRGALGRGAIIQKNPPASSEPWRGAPLSQLSYNVPETPELQEKIKNGPDASDTVRTEQQIKAIQEESKPSIMRQNFPLWIAGGFAIVSAGAFLIIRILFL